MTTRRRPRTTPIQADTEGIVGLPEPQSGQHAYFWVHEGILGLHVRCGSCGRTTHAYPSLFTFVECKCCGEALHIDWHLGVA